MSFYAYAIIRLDEGRQPPLQIAGHQLLTVIKRRLALVGERLESQKEVNSLHDILLHEQIVETLSRNYPLLPIQFGMILKERDEAKGILIRNYDLLFTKITQLAGQIELGVKIFWEQKGQSHFLLDKMRASAREANGSGETGNRALDYMLKLRKRYGNREGQSLAEHLSAGFNSSFLKVANDGQYRTLRTESLLFDGSYLLDRDNISLFKEVVEGIEDKFSGLSILASGPWPPYSFCNLDLAGDAFPVT